MPSRWDAATHGWSRRVFHYPLPTLMSKNFRLPCTIELQPLSLTPLKMRKVELKTLCALFVAVILVAMVGSAAPAAAQGTTPATGNIVVRDGSQPGEVIVSWDAVPQATHYRIGYVNMVTDYPLAKASVTGEWIEAFIYADVNAQNFTVIGGRTEYTLRRLQQGARHAFTVRTSNNIDGVFTWPSSPRWTFHEVADSGGACPTATTPPSTTTPQTPLTNAELAERVRPALAKIVVTNSDGSTSSGTGFVVRSDGLVVTNRHVVDDASSVSVLIHARDGSETEFAGRVLGRGILADLAVIRLPAGRTYTALSLGNSDDVVQGDEITSWGYALGSFLGSDPTLTRGIISSTNRIFDDTKYLQTDATIARGNSGGPVVDRFGRVVGVNTAVLVQIREDGTEVPIPGIYLAIAINEVSNRLNAMAAGGPASATYRNLRFDYGYRIDIPKGWYLGHERPSFTQFLPYGGRRIAYIDRYEFRAPLGTKSSALSSLANYVWDTSLPNAAEDWDYFQKTSKTQVIINGQVFYRLEWRVRWEPGLCILNYVATVSVSSSFPNKPIGFVAGNGICEGNLSAYNSERQTMLNSFLP